MGHIIKHTFFGATERVPLSGHFVVYNFDEFIISHWLTTERLPLTEVFPMHRFTMQVLSQNDNRSVAQIRDINTWYKYIAPIGATQSIFK